MKKRTEWSGNYRGIPFEINKFDTYEKKDGWTFYIYLRESQFSEEDFQKLWLPPQKDEKFKRIWYSYSYSIISDIKFHGGCTYYDKLGGHDGEKRCVKVGCDYQHYWDEGHYYSDNSVENDAKEAIDSLYELFPNIKQWCFNCGAWGNEHVSIKEGSLLCPNCHKERMEKELTPTPSNKDER